MESNRWRFVKAYRFVRLARFGKRDAGEVADEWLGIPQISTGDMLREHIRQGDGDRVMRSWADAGRDRWFRTNW
jgi:hypothetical protein